MSLTYFEVTGTFKAVISDTSDDVDGDPDTDNISSFVYFTPSVNQVWSTTDDTIYRLQPIRARTNVADGILKNIDGTTVNLVANTAELENSDGTALDLTYAVTFDHVVYDEADREIAGFTFQAPTDDTAINLATVERITP